MLSTLRKSLPTSAKKVLVESTLIRAGTAYHNQTIIRNYRQTAKVQNDLIIGGFVLGASALTLQYGLKAYDAFSQRKAEKSAQTSADETPAATESTEDSTINHADSGADSATMKAAKEEARKKEAAKNKTNTNVDSWFGNWNNWFAKNFYDGGFEDKMTKREAALILGVRESAQPQRIKDAHRRIMQINHPDKGGSAYLTAKVNEAKDLLLKGK